jgi:hypothetical protein
MSVGVASGKTTADTPPNDGIGSSGFLDNSHINLPKIQVKPLAQARLHQPSLVMKPMVCRLVKLSL